LLSCEEAFAGAQINFAAFLYYQISINKCKESKEKKIVKGEEQEQKKECSCLCLISNKLKGP